MSTKISPKQKAKLKRSIRAALNGTPFELHNLFLTLSAEQKAFALQELKRLVLISEFLESLEDLEKKYHEKSK